MDKIIKNINKSWQICKNNYIFINDLCECTISVKNGAIYIDGDIKYTNVNMKTTVFFSGCENVSVSLYQKINHIILEKSSNVQMIISDGIIGGLDILHCKSVDFVVMNKDVFYISYGNSVSCNASLDKKISTNTLISTICCHEINFVIVPSVFRTNSSLFSGMNLMAFVPCNSDVELHYVKTIDGCRYNGKITGTLLH